MLKRNSTIVFNGIIVDIEQFDAEVGSKGFHTFQVIRHPGGVAVLPFHDDGTVTLIRQFRPAVAQWLYEIPTGRRDQNEDAATCGHRELLEETGLTAGKLLPLGEFYASPGVFDELIHLFAAVDLSQGAAQPELDEDIETLRIPFAEAEQMAKDGRITDGKTIAAILRGTEVIR